MNPWSCMGVSFSRAIGIEFADFVKCVGHSGAGEANHNGFHPQECIDVALHYGFSCTPIQLFAGMIYGPGQPPVVLWSKEEATRRFEKYVNSTKRGVFEGIRLKEGNKGIGHAVALIDGMIYDNETKYPVAECTAHNFHPQTLWIIKNEQVL